MQPNNKLENQVSMKKCTSIIMATCLFFCFVFISCEKKEVSKMRYLRLNSPEEPITLDPRKGGDVVSSCLHFMLYGTLTKTTSDASSVPAIAEKIDISDDKTVYTFHLRESKWSDGSLILAKDYEFSWKSMLDPKFPCPNANLLYFIKNAEDAKKGLVSLDEIAIKALDDKTLEVTLEHPTPFFIKLLSFCVFAPVKETTVTKHSNWADKISENFITNGPYKLVKWAKEKEIILEKNPHYWDADNVSLEGIHISIIKDENTAVAMFEKNELDLLGGIYSDIPVDAIEHFKEDQTLARLPVGKTVFCSFNTQRSPFNNKWIRKALSLAINREEIVQTIPEFNSLPAHNFITPVLKDGINEKFFTPFNNTLAAVCLQKGLEELNMTKEDFAKFTLIYMPNDVHTKLVQAIQSDWRRYLGIDVKLQGFDRKLFYTKTATADYDICLHYWAAQYADQMNIFDRFRVSNNPKNYCNWENETYKDLLSQSYYLSGSERDDILREAEKIFLEEMPLAPIYHSGKVYAIQPYVKGFYTSPIGSGHFEKIEFDKVDQRI